MSRSDAKRWWEPGTARGKHPSLCHDLRPTWQEQAGQLSWAGTGTHIPSRAGGRADEALERLLPVRCCSAEHTCLGWGEGRCMSVPKAKAKCSHTALPPNN